MGHTITPRKRATEALRLPLDHFAGWRLAVDCGSPECARGRTYDMKQLARMYRGLTLGRALTRLRCNGCTRAPTAVVLRPGPDMDARRTAEIALVGPGSV